MLGSRGRLAAMAIGLALAGGVGGMAIPARHHEITINASKKAKPGLFGGHRWHNPMQYGHRGAGISMAQQQRASKKARNVRRHRASVKR